MRLKNLLPKIIWSRAYAKISRLAAACRLSRQEMKETSTTTMTARNPTSPIDALSSVTMGSVSLPDITAPMSEIDSTKARQTQMAAAPPM